MSFFAPVGVVLKSLAHRFGLETKLVESRLRRHWPDIAGDHIAAHTRPDQIRFKKLYLFAESSVWAQQLAFLKPMLIEKVNAVAGSAIVSDIVLRVGEVGETKRQTEDRERAAPSAEEPEPGEACWDEASSHAQHVKDQELREHLTRLMATAAASRDRTHPQAAKQATRPTPRRPARPPQEVP